MKREIRDLYYSYMPKSDYFQYLEGDVGVYITAPHGGGMKPRNIPRRRSGKLLMDTYTRRLTNRIYELGGVMKPYCLIADIHRSRVDLNRSLQDATDGDERAINIWKSWNDHIEYVLPLLVSLYSKVLYIDIHSHNDSDSFQLGYNLNARDYNNLFYTGRETASSTLDSWPGTQYDMIFGDGSFKNVLEFYDYDVFKPTGQEVYFNGGRNIEHFSGGRVAAIQIECPVSMLKYEFDRVAESIVTCYKVFTMHYAY